MVNEDSASVSILDGATGAAKNVSVGEVPFAVAVNPTANKAYVLTYLGSTMAVIDGAAGTVTRTVPLATHPSAIAVNPKANQIYIANQNAANVTVIDGTTGENGPTNNANIKIEIDPNLATPADGTPDYTTLVWVPGPNPVKNPWSPFIDATSDGYWYYTGNEGTATSCSQAAPHCSLQGVKGTLATNNNGVPAIDLSIASERAGHEFQGAVDGLRINDQPYDFESGPEGVKAKGVK